MSAWNPPSSRANPNSNSPFSSMSMRRIATEPGE
jgi:hypothetical protein